MSDSSELSTAKKCISKLNVIISSVHVDRHSLGDHNPVCLWLPAPRQLETENAFAEMGQNMYKQRNCQVVGKLQTLMTQCGIHPVRCSWQVSFQFTLSLMKSPSLIATLHPDFLPFKCLATIFPESSPQLHGCNLDLMQRSPWFSKPFFSLFSRTFRPTTTWNLQSPSPGRISMSMSSEKHNRSAAAHPV